MVMNFVQKLNNDLRNLTQNTQKDLTAIEFKQLLLAFEKKLDEAVKTSQSQVSQAGLQMAGAFASIGAAGVGAKVGIEGIGQVIGQGLQGSITGTGGIVGADFGKEAHVVRAAIDYVSALTELVRRLSGENRSDAKNFSDKTAQIMEALMAKIQGLAGVLENMIRP
jgi:hypothetical protein